MRYQILKGCVAGGRARRLGSIVELDDEEGRNLMLMGRVAPYDEPKEPENRSIGLDEESKPRRRGRPRKTED